MKIARCRFFPRHLFSVIKVRSPQTPYKEENVNVSLRNAFEVNPKKNLHANSVCMSFTCSLNGRCPEKHQTGFAQINK